MTTSELAHSAARERLALRYSSDSLRVAATAPALTEPMRRLARRFNCSFTFGRTSVATTLAPSRAPWRSPAGGDAGAMTKTWPEPHAGRVVQHREYRLKLTAAEPVRHCSRRGGHRRDKVSIDWRTRRPRNRVGGECVTFRAPGRGPASRCGANQRADVEDARSSRRLAGWGRNFQDKIPGGKSAMGQRTTETPRSELLTV